MGQPPTTQPSCVFTQNNNNNENNNENNNDNNDVSGWRLRWSSGCMPDVDR